MLRQLYLDATYLISYSNYMERYTIKEFNKQYPSDEACLAEVFETQGHAGRPCPSCDKDTKFHKVVGRKCYKCQYCAYEIYPLAETIFHKSRTPLKSWFFAIFLFSNSRNGVAAKELERHLGVTYKTAWRMAKLIRGLFDEGDFTLSGTVEADETYVGGKRRGKRGRGAAGKTPVVGIVERNGRVVGKVAANTKRSTVQPMIERHLATESEIMTDEWWAYSKLNEAGYKHDTVNHGRKEYVRGKVHTNTIEGFWSQLKRSISGTYHAVSPKYLQFYVNEFAYRYNHRSDQQHLFHGLVDVAMMRV